MSVPCLPILRVDSQGYGFADRKLCAQEIDPVIWVDFVVISGFNEGEGKHALLLQIRFVLQAIRVSLTLPKQPRTRHTIRAKLRVMMARPPRCLGSRAACSLELPSP